MQGCSDNNGTKSSGSFHQSTMDTSRIQDDIRMMGQLRHELHHSRQLLQLIFDTIPQGVWWKDRDLGYLGCNLRAARDAGLSSPEFIIGKTDAELPWRDLADRYQRDDRQVLETGVPKIHYEEDLRTANGSVMRVSACRIPLRDQAGVILGVLGTYEDITERRRSTAALETAVEDLRRSNEELEQFAYVASHDLQEPLRMVASFTQLLAERYRGKLDERADKYIAYAVDGARRMQELINALLTLSRVGTHGYQFERVALSEIVAEVRLLLHQAIEESQATIVSSDLPTVVADRVQMLQLLQNLVGNAIKFRSEHPPLISISARREPGFHVISVKDNGIGIDPRYHERVFAIFQRLHERGRYTGSGIGLAIAKKIAERHGGRISIDSTLGAGACFRFTLSTSLVATVKPL